MMNNSKNLGIAWYYEEDWEEWKNISDDELEDNYEDWLISAELTKVNVEKEFGSIEKVYLKPKEFKIWCKKNFKKLNSSSRSEYVAKICQTKSEKSSLREK